MGFKNAREKCGMTQNEAAKALGTDQSAVCLWENRKNKTSCVFVAEDC